ncbi:vacuolar protein sorting-associated protein-like protein vps5 [Venturia nashicola]|uniref:Vacuolar protein sorting-associated protein-like protein vps5 n=1 Tax=Venturia nashicola TaxID=86259 RepID=A0A4Z1NXW3_9PEZI|nr:vacuolar protein sorting-associated protein-like protein vps5 [Venturia nashicola]TLD32450.1 vacuolar protein sorting-associated protein-like protein vps5 [Venturia nashicola]
MSDPHPHPIDVSAKPITSPSSVQSIRSAMNIPPMTMDDHEASPWDDVPSQSSSPSQNLPKSNPDSTLGSSQNLQTSIPNSTATSSRPRGRGKKVPARFGAQPTKLEAVDDTLGPLGPLGAPAQSQETLVESQHENGPLQAPRATGASTQSSLQGMMGSVDLDDHEDEEGNGPRRPRQPPPVQPPQSDGPPRQVAPSVNVVEAAKPTFHIVVGDPHKVGDLTSAHTEYNVDTKTTSKAYRTPEFSVSRRFRDFLWLYNQLHQNNPGIIVPPPPEKQAVGRFNADFVESRRQALERMLNKIALHPTLQHDGDLKLFLESEAFNVDIKHKERKEPLVGESKGLFGMGGSTGKFVEHDDWFHDRKIYLEGLENQLKTLQKATDTVIAQRKSLAEACGDFSASLHSLAAVELSPLLSGPLDELSNLQMRIRELYERQAQQDVLTLGIVIDEYIRLIGSCKKAFEMRQRSYHSWHAAESDLAKRKNMQDKLLRQGRSQTDRLNQLSAEVADAGKKAHQTRLLFDDMGRILRQELDRFEREKVEEFKSGVETYLEGAVEAQKELIETWETYLMRMDAEDDAATLVEEETREAEAKKNQPVTERPESQGIDASGPAALTGATLSDEGE